MMFDKKDFKEKIERDGYCVIEGVLDADFVKRAKLELEIAIQKEGISVNYYDYSGYPEYSQKFPPFTHGVSMLDLLFSIGDEAKNYMKMSQMFI